MRNHDALLTVPLLGVAQADVTVLRPTAESRKLEHDHTLNCKPKKEGTQAHIILHPCSSFVESTI